METVAKETVAKEMMLSSATASTSKLFLGKSSKAGKLPECTQTCEELGRLRSVYQYTSCQKVHHGRSRIGKISRPPSAPLCVTLLQANQIAIPPSVRVGIRKFIVRLSQTWRTIFSSSSYLNLTSLGFEMIGNTIFL